MVVIKLVVKSVATNLVRDPKDMHGLEVQRHLANLNPRTPRSPDPSNGRLNLKRSPLALGAPLRSHAFRVEPLAINSAPGAALRREGIL
jgi:hypothetical protein